MFYYEIDFLEEKTKEVKKDKGIIAGDKWEEAVKKLVEYYGNYDAKEDYGLISIEKLYPLEEVLDYHSMAGLFSLLVPYEEEKKKHSDKLTNEQLDQLLDCVIKGEYNSKETTGKSTIDLKVGDNDHISFFQKMGLSTAEEMYK